MERDIDNKSGEEKEIKKELENEREKRDKRKIENEKGED